MALSARDSVNGSRDIRLSPAFYLPPAVPDPFHGVALYLRQATGGFIWTRLLQPVICNAISVAVLRHCGFVRPAQHGAEPDGAVATSARLQSASLRFARPAHAKLRTVAPREFAAFQGNQARWLQHRRLARKQPFEWKMFSV